MNKITRQIIIVSVILVFLAPLVYFTYPQLTGSATMINSGMLEKEGWTFTETKNTENGTIYYYNQGNSTELIIRTRTYDTESDAMNALAGHYNLKNMRDAEYIKYKEGAFHAIYLNKFFGRGPWLTLNFIDKKDYIELIYTNEEKGTEYSGDYDKDLDMLKDLAIKLFGE